MTDLAWIFISGALLNNFVLAYFLGLCPVIGVTSRIDTATRLGLATTLVMVLASLAAWTLNTLVLPVAPYLRVIAFIVTIAAIVQVVEMVVKKTSPVLFRQLGIFLPLIASNSQVLGMAIFQTNRDYTLAEGLAFAIGGGVGITLVMALVASMRVATELAPLPKYARGPALVFMLAGSLSLIFLGFAGLFA